MAKECARTTRSLLIGTEKQGNTSLISEGLAKDGNNLGLLYMQGLGVPKDYVQAYMWFSLSNSESNLSDAKDQLTPAQVSEAERMIEDWKRNHPEP